ncbi:MAG: V-type ATP synthase subunit E [Candidatus Thermoplasmatota archaeon]|nr:V-type ATP synthase subunit E [Candidatus Thermoplasmatota archaeon]
MSAEQIITRIHHDAQQEVDRITQDAERQADAIITEAKEQAKRDADQIIRKATEEAENIRRILISKAQRELKQEMMNVQEEIIEQCFTEAYQRLVTLKDKNYTDIVTRLIQKGKQQLGADCQILVSRDIDKTIAAQENLIIQGTIPSQGGVILQTSDGKITLDNTFENILSRKKDELRITIGTLLFPT